MKTERFAGVMTAFLGIGGALLALFAPLNTNEECSAAVDGPPTCSSWSSNLWQDDRGDAVKALAIIGMLALLVGLGAVVDTHAARRHRALLALATAALVLLTFLTMFSVGAFSFPQRSERSWLRSLHCVGATDRLRKRSRFRVVCRGRLAARHRSRLAHGAGWKARATVFDGASERQQFPYSPVRPPRAKIAL